jgi:hypothetical protein
MTSTSSIKHLHQDIFFDFQTINGIDTYGHQSKKIGIKTSKRTSSTHLALNPQAQSCLSNKSAEV